MERIRRRPIDRLMSLFRPVSRYRCTMIHCRWEANFPRVFADDGKRDSITPR